MKKLFSLIKNITLRIYLRCISSETYVCYLRKHGIKVGENVRFRYPAHTLIDLNRPSLVETGNNVDINDNFSLLTHDFGTYVLRGKYKDFVNSSGKVKIGNNVVVGRDVSILKGVEIGDNVIIALGSVITRSIPSNSVAAGVPCRVICSLDDYYKKRKEKQVPEALEYAASITDRFDRQPRIEELYEEWVLFLTNEEYEKYPTIRKHVDYRLNGYADKNEFLSRPKQFNGFEDFLQNVKKFRCVKKHE